MSQPRIVLFTGFLQQLEGTVVIESEVRTRQQVRRNTACLATAVQGLSQAIAFRSSTRNIVSVCQQRQRHRRIRRQFPRLLKGGDGFTALELMQVRSARAQVGPHEAGFKLEHPLVVLARSLMFTGDIVSGAEASRDDERERVQMVRALQLCDRFF